jgi:hypothetical protein
MRTETINAALERTITKERLDKYLAKTDGNVDLALKLYEENTRLSEAFYTPLQGVEVCLRNCLHRRLTERYGVEWYQNGQPAFEGDARGMIDSAVAEAGPGATPGDVVAELKFAFWVSILGRTYDATLWRQCLYKAFLAAGGKPRDPVHSRFNVIRRFRNRVMHHEPIFHRPLQQLHDEIIEAVSWMCKDTAAWVEHHSRFQAVLSTIEKPGQN